MKYDFTDEVVIEIFAGKGGDGSMSFRREKYVPKGGPDGGDGGNGGNVILKSVLSKNTLIDFKYKRKFRAEDAENGRQKNQFGADGNDLIIEVPAGTAVYDFETNEMIADLQYPNQYIVIARGGKGGKGNRKFVSSKMQVPKIFEKGAPGEEVKVKLVLKLLADIGIVGFPNVGKSTFISKISNAKPKIANYPFTTLVPNLGVVKVDEGLSFVVADIPGIIEGAHEGIGLGIMFLKHVERCYVLLHLIDISGIEGRDPYDDYLKLRNEMEKYSEILSNKREIIAVNKCDLLPSEEVDEKVKLLEEKIGKKVYKMSAYTSENVDIIKGALWQAIEPDRLERIRKLEKLLRKREEKIKLEIDPVKFDTDIFFKIEIVKWSENVYEVTGKGIETLLLKYDIDKPDSRMKIMNILQKNGLEKALKTSEVKEGDTVYVGDFPFEYIL
jgi:GTP-binding protein